MSDKKSELLYRTIMVIAHQLTFVNDPIIRDELYRELMDKVMIYHKIAIEAEKFIDIYNELYSETEES